MDNKASLHLTTATLTALFLLAALWAALHASSAAATAAPLAITANPGDVVINEVAWGGTAASSADEWIELYNTTAQPILLAGWRLYSADGGPDATLSGSILPQGYYLLERTADDTISDVPADWTGSFGTGLSNSGEILTLTDPDARVIDTANQGGGAWPAGSGSPGYYSMERVAPHAPDADGNWVANDGLSRNGYDAAGQPINGTPKARNSAYAAPSGSEADLVVTKSGPSTAPAGSCVTYTLYLTNSGFLTATSVRLTDALPAAVTFISETSSFPFDRSAGLLVWTIGDLPTRTPPLLITVTGQLSTTASGLIRNLVTATTTAPETRTGDNHALWETQLTGAPGESTLLITALLYDGQQADDRDEAIQVVNVSDALIDLSGWKICDGVVGSTCAVIPGGTLAAHDAVWLAYWASDFYTSSGFYPAYAVKGLAPGALALSGTWPRYANAGEAAVLRDPDDRVVDTLVYNDGDTNTWGWTGAAVQPWGGGGVFRAEGQILYRQIDEASALPVPDTDSAADWAQYAADPFYGRRVRYPGWDLETFFQPLRVTEAAHLAVGVAPDNAADLLLDAIRSATGRIEIVVYALTHPTIITELVKAAQAGITVTLLLEGDQAGISKSDPRWYQQMWACQQLHDTGHGACWFMVSDDQADVYARYRFMHAKYVLVDRQQVLITSQNLTDRGLPDDDRSNGTSGSRGVLLVTDAPAVVARVAQLFDRDLDPAQHADLLPWSPTGFEYGPPPPTYTPILTVTDLTTYTVVFSTPLTLEGSFEFELFTAPEAALRRSDALLGLLARAGTGDQVYVEALDERAHWGQDPINDPNPRMEAYLTAARRGARVRILLNSGQFDAPYYDASPNLAAVAYANAVARDEGLDLKATTGDPTQFGVHNKLVLVWLAGSGGYVHLGSLNGSETSSKANRELALQIRSDPLYDYLKAVFDWDWNISNPLYLPFILRDWSPPAPPVGYPVVSEVLYDPPGIQEGGEWVELYNSTDRAVDLADWHLGDVGPTGEFGSGLYTFPDSAILPADGVILIARQAEDVLGFTPDFEFLIDPLRDDPDVRNMERAGAWDGFGFALGNAGDEVILLDAHAAPVDVLVYGTGSYPGILPHPGVSASGHSLERRPAIYDTDDCSHDFFDRNPPDPGSISRE